MFIFIKQIREQSRLGNGFNHCHPCTKKQLVKILPAIQFGWPLGMPLVEKIKPFLWEVRSRVPDGIARVLFTIDGNIMILLHGFIKKTKKTPKNELKTALARLKKYQED